MRLSPGSPIIGRMIDKLAQALTLMGEAFADAQVGAANLTYADLPSRSTPRRR